MNESLAEKIARHRAVVGWLEWQLGQTREALARLEQQEAATAARRPEPQVPDWKVEMHRTGYGPAPSGSTPATAPMATVRRSAGRRPADS